MMADRIYFPSAAALLTVLLVLPSAVRAQANDRPVDLKPQISATGLKQPASEVELGYSRENLTNNFSDWTSTYLLGTHRFGDRKTLYGGLRQTRRFGLDDSEAHAGLYFPLGSSWSSQIEASYSPTHEVLARSSVYGQIQKSFAGGWGLGFGVRHNEYSLVSSNVVSAMAERYWGNFRGAYTLYSGRPEGASSAASHRFQLSYYYSDRNAVGLSFTDGREIENVGPPRGVVSSDVQSWGITGQHWFARSWALTYDVVQHEQGTLYRRQGLRLGVRHSF